MLTTHRADEHVDALVVGSGFGGSVSAYRLADAGESVVLPSQALDQTAAKRIQPAAQSRLQNS